MTEQLSKEDLAYFRRNVQLMFQNPFEAMNPRFTIFQSLEEPLIIHDIGTKEERRERVIEMLEKVNLSPVERYMYSYPHQLSGGQLQRAVLARALIDRKSTRLNSSHVAISYAVFCLKKKKQQ